MLPTRVALAVDVAVLDGGSHWIHHYDSCKGILAKEGMYPTYTVTKGFLMYHYNIMDSQPSGELCARSEALWYMEFLLTLVAF